ncbi:MAG: AI-2E family transporter [Actinomycetota bacterium]|nr:AI-2E family transporter [Actinomycetota bacterium]
MARTGGTIDVDRAAPAGRSLRLSIPTITWLVLLAGFVAVVAVSGIISRAQRPLGWALAAIVLAAALHPAVAVLDRRMPRPIAVLAVILAASAIFGGTLFMLAWGRRRFRAAAGEIDDPARRARLSRVVERAFRDSQHYVSVTVIGAVIVFAVAFATYSLIDLPGAAPLALLAALASTVPVVGLLSGVVPAVALEAGHRPSGVRRDADLLRHRVRPVRSRRCARGHRTRRLRCRTRRLVRRGPPRCGAWMRLTNGRAGALT